jgi:predicted membrane channel-forming protein YqfA (hemolysin III family)
MKLSRERRASSPDACLGQINWDYDRAEVIADGAVHAIGVCLGFIGAVTIVVIAISIERIEVAPILIYVIGLVTMLVLSAAYNMWPVSPAKWVLRRLDHSAIYLLIAGTYTPFLAQMKSVLDVGGPWRPIFVVAECSVHIQGVPTGAALALKMRPTTTPSSNKS